MVIEWLMSTTIWLTGQPNTQHDSTTLASNHTHHRLYDIGKHHSSEQLAGVDLHEDDLTIHKYTSGRASSTYPVGATRPSFFLTELSSAYLCHDATVSASRPAQRTRLLSHAIATRTQAGRHSITTSGLQSSAT